MLKIITLFFILCSFPALAQHEEKPFHINEPLPDTLCFTAKIATYRKNVQETFYEVKITCKNCAEEDFKNFHFYKRWLFDTLPQSLKSIEQLEADCKCFKK
jgi:RPA family protein